MINTKIGHFLLLSASLSLCHGQSPQPKLIDCHVHHNGSDQFLQQLVAKLEPVEGMAMLITAPKDVPAVTAFMRTHPNRLIGVGEIELDAPDVLATIDRYQKAHFRGLGEITRPEFSYDDRRYWPIYERAEKYGMVILFHTGIVNRTHPETPDNTSSDRMRVSTLDRIARRYPKLTLIGAHLGNPDYAWAGELARWNPNLYFDVSGSTLLKKQDDYKFFQSIFWWTNAVSPHTPKAQTLAFEKLVFGSDVFEGDLAEFDGELDRYHRMLDACNVPASAQANIFGGTLWRILNR